MESKSKTVGERGQSARESVADLLSLSKEQRQRVRLRLMRWLSARG